MHLLRSWGFAALMGLAGAPHLALGAVQLLRDFSESAALQPLYTMSPQCGFCPNWQMDTVSFDQDRSPLTKNDLGSTLMTCGTNSTIQASPMDYLFIIDGSSGMSKYGENILAAFSSIGMATPVSPAQDLRYAVVAVGGLPDLILAPTNNTAAFMAAVKYVMDPANARPGQEATLEAIRIALTDQPMWASYGFRRACLDTVSPCEFAWRPKAKKNIFIFTDEDSDVPANVGMRTAAQAVKENQLCSTATDQSFDSQTMVYKCASSSAIEPSWVGPRALVQALDSGTISNRVMRMVRKDGGPAYLHPAAQEEVLLTARYVLRANAFVSLFMRPAGGIGSDGPVASWNDANPIYDPASAADNVTTAVWQFGHPALNVHNASLAGFDRLATYNKLVLAKLSNSLQALVLGGGGYMRVLDIDQWLGTTEKQPTLGKTLAEGSQACLLASWDTDIAFPTRDRSGNPCDCALDRVVVPMVLYKAAAMPEKAPASLPVYGFSRDCGACPAEVTTPSTSSKTWNSQLIECNGVGSMMVDYLFLIDTSHGANVNAQVAFDKAHQSIFSAIAVAGQDARVSIVVIGGPPALRMAPTNNEATFNATLAQIFKVERNGQESMLEAIRISLSPNPMNTKYGFLQQCVTESSNLCTFRWRAGAAKNIVAITNEDSDLPYWPANRNSAQTPDSSMCAMMTRMDFQNGTSILPWTTCSSSSLVEPAWVGPKVMLAGRLSWMPEFISPNSQQWFRSTGDKIALHPAYQREVLDTARLLIKNQVFLTITVDANGGSNNPWGPVSVWNPKNPLYRAGTDFDNVSQAMRQYGDPNLSQDVETGYNLTSTYNNHLQNGLSGSLTSLVLSGGGWVRLWDYNRVVDRAVDRDLFQRLVSINQQCRPLEPYFPLVPASVASDVEICDCTEQWPDTGLITVVTAPT
ncbi:hypothetical protein CAUPRSCDRAFT_10345, partial [Caulochytrium protostelioides]